MPSARPTLKRTVGALVSSAAILAVAHATPAGQLSPTPHELQVLIYVVNACEFEPSAATGAALLKLPFVQERIARAAKGGGNGLEEVNTSDCQALARMLKQR